jgi:hypothetical protein
MTIAQRAAAEVDAAYRVGQLTLSNGAASLGGIERQRPIDLAIAEQPALLGTAAGKDATRAPQMRVCPVEPGS